MATRKVLYRKFGPKLMEALALTVKDELNILRIAAGLPERTNQQIVDAVSSKLDGIVDYDWMT